MNRTSNTWRSADKAIRLSAAAGELVDLDLNENELPIGATFFFEDAALTFLSGFTQPPDNWEIESTSEYNNAGSIVLRLTYQEKSILFMGDAVGRHNGGPENELIATEKFLIENSTSLVIDSDVLVASHHGADNGSAKGFIEAVSPDWVIFSAGHEYGHPRSSTAERFLNFGVDIDRIYRTDLGDDEGGTSEWQFGRIDGTRDDAGDDDINITISRSGHITVSQ